jgi:hypothetical protein
MNNPINGGTAIIDACGHSAAIVDLRDRPRQESQRNATRVPLGRDNNGTGRLARFRNEYTNA